MIAIIPARGGSKRLPGKNLKLFHGKPLISYTIEAALKSEHINQVIVSTDDIEIAKVAEEYGAVVPFLRPEALSTDNAKSSDVINFMLQYLEKNSSEEISSLIILQPTSPLRTSGEIDGAIQLFNSKKADAVISYCEEQHPIFWHKFLNRNNQFENIFSEKKNSEGHFEKKSYYPNGAIYIFKRNIILTGDYYTHNSYAYVMSRNKSIDIDTIEDFEYAEFLYRRSLEGS